MDIETLEALHKILVDLRDVQALTPTRLRAVAITETEKLIALFHYVRSVAP